jgi:hypothetical protein
MVFPFLGIFLINKVNVRAVQSHKHPIIQNEGYQDSAHIMHKSAELQMETNGDIFQDSEQISRQRDTESDIASTGNNVCSYG